LQKNVDNFLWALEKGAVNIANLLRPQIIIIGGGISGAADLILPAVNAALQSEVYGFHYAPVKAVVAKLGNWAGVIGAANLQQSQ